MRRFLFYAMISSALYADASSILSYALSGGRLGDSLIAYAHARWLAYIHDMPFAYRPFPYAEQFQFTTMHKKISCVDDENCVPITHTKTRKGKLVLDRDAGLTYVVPYFPEVLYDRKMYFECTNVLLFHTDWEDPDFKHLLKQEIAPCHELVLPANEVPGYHLVTIHVRTGGGYKHDVLSNGNLRRGQATHDMQNPLADEIFPLKFPPLSFYADALRKMAHLLPDKPLHIRLLTDSQEPAKLAHTLQQLVPLEGARYEYREVGNHHEENVLLDLFTLVDAAYLIRGESNFSLIAEKLGSPGIAMYPHHGRWSAGEFTITETACTIRTNEGLAHVTYVAG